MGEIVSVTNLIDGIDSNGLQFIEEEKERWNKTNNLQRESGTNHPHNSIFYLFSLSSGKEKLDKIGALKPFNNQLVIDLGAGDASMATAYEVAEIGGAKAYVAVELHADGRSAFRLRLFSEERNIPCALVAEDMLSFLRRLPDKSISSICSGIDSHIIDYSYADKVSEELRRVIHPDGAYLTSITTIVQPFRGNPDNIDLSYSTKLYSPRITELSIDKK